jgi:ABC-type lipoprotein export system ATPase subunit
MVNPAVPVVPTQQKLLKFIAHNLKNLCKLEMDLCEKPLVAIMGANRSGKTTILHALACVYKKPDSSAPEYRFPQFFKPNTDTLWVGSSFSIEYSQRLGAQVQNGLKQDYSKLQDRWTPRNEKKPIRYTRFVNIKDSVPDVETLNLNAMVHYQKQETSTSIGHEIRDMAGKVLNINYDHYHQVTYKHTQKKSIGVTAGTHTYSALSMSSGEQRVFRILDAVFHAPDFSLLLIDEIDLFLHQDALIRLIDILNEHCTRKKKQLIFTTHFPPLARMYSQVSVRTIHRAAQKTILWHGYSYDGMRYMTGEQSRPLSIYVEDDVAGEIVSKVANELGIRKYLEIGHYGPAINAFTLGAGRIIEGKSLDNVLIVLDGDVISSKSDRTSRVKAILTGDRPEHEANRARVIKAIRRFYSKDGVSPEQMIHRMATSLSVETASLEELGLLEIVHSITNVADTHDFIDKIVEHSGEERRVALVKLITFAARTTNWQRYTKLIRAWLKKRAGELNLLTDAPSHSLNRIPS